MDLRKVTLALTGLCVLVLQAWAQLEVSMEDRVEVLLGDMAEIPCIYNLSHPAGSLTIQWLVRSPSNNNKVQIYYKDKNEELYPDTEFSERIKVYHDDTAGSTVLTITEVRLKDEREFVCEVHGHSGHAQGHTKLLVFNTPSMPTIERRPYTSAVTQEKEEVASCEVNNAYPAPNITWYRNRSVLQPSEDNMEMKNTLTMNPSGLFTAHSVLFLQVVKEDKDAMFYCEVSYLSPGGERMMESKLINIEVHYPTANIKINQDSPTRLVKEGDRVEISCKGDGNPQPIFSFIFNNDVLPSELGQLVLDQVTRENSGLYQCSSLDQLSFNELTDSLELMVHYLDPVVITPEKSLYMLELGQDMSLTCNALSSLPTHTAWLKDGTVLVKGHVLNLLDLSYSMAGTYVCEVYVPSLTELQRQKSVHINVRGKPVIEEELVMIPLDAEEAAVNLSCSAIGHPTPNIQWSFSDNQTILGEWITETDYAILSVITIRATADITVSCMATSELGNAQAFRNVTAIEMKKPTSTQAAIVTPQKEGSGVIIAVIIILILLLAILGSVLYFFYKKGKIPCGRSGKQDLTKEKSSKDDVVVEMKGSRSEEAVLLQGVNGEKKSPTDQ